jgi:hypothetical protein
MSIDPVHNLRSRFACATPLADPSWASTYANTLPNFVLGMPALFVRTVPRADVLLGFRWLFAFGTLLRGLPSGSGRFFRCLSVQSASCTLFPRRGSPSPLSYSVPWTWASGPHGPPSSSAFGPWPPVSRAQALTAPVMDIPRFSGSFRGFYLIF